MKGEEKMKLRDGWSFQFLIGKVQPAGNWIGADSLFPMVFQFLIGKVQQNFLYYGKISFRKRFQFLIGKVQHKKRT